MEARTNKVQRSLADAEKSRKEAEELVRKYEEQLKNIQAEADNIVKETKKKAQQEAAQIIADGRLSAERLVANAHKQIEEDREAALALFRAEAAALVVSASSALIKRDLTQEDNLRFAGMLLQELRK